mmetsp:Transcript_139108/g.242041  ORF Transcript_139108/g.242041 Transcript_139108/m.242041 type:complete len:213 (+) Transcript_139108:434-1072(+)
MESQWCRAARLHLLSVQSVVEVTEVQLLKPRTCKPPFIECRIGRSGADSPSIKSSKIHLFYVNNLAARYAACDHVAPKSARSFCCLDGLPDKPLAGMQPLANHCVKSTTTDCIPTTATQPALLVLTIAFTTAPQGKNLRSLRISASQLFLKISRKNVIVRSKDHYPIRACAVTFCQQSCFFARDTIIVHMSILAVRCKLVCDIWIGTADANN